MPNDWKCGLLVKLPKKGDTINCDNWRGITLLSVPSKVLSRVLLSRMKEHVNLRLRKVQAGFRPNLFCIDQINTLRIIIEQCIEWSSRLHTVFIDFEKAFDTINREAMWNEVKHYGVPTQIVNLIQETYRGYACRVVHEGRV
jgi:sorting nexin-29